MGGTEPQKGTLTVYQTRNSGVQHIDVHTQTHRCTCMDTHTHTVRTVLWF